MAGRDEILLNFQACTHMEDFDICISVLEQHNWNLEEAVQAFLDDSYGNTNSTSVETATDVIVQNENLTDELQPIFSDVPHSDIGLSSQHSNTRLEASSSVLRHKRVINFEIIDRDKTHHVVLPDSSCVFDIKRCLAVELNLPIEDIKLSGWCKQPTATIFDSTRLYNLNLPQSNKLLLFSPHNTKEDGGDSAVNIDNAMYRLKILDVDRGNFVEVSYPGSTRLNKVRHDHYLRSDVPSKHQIWSGWPSQVCGTSNVMLCETGVSSFLHNLQVGDMRKQKLAKQSFLKKENSSATGSHDSLMNIDDDDEISDNEDDTYYEESIDTGPEMSVGGCSADDTSCVKPTKKNVDDVVNPRRDKLIPMDLDGSDETACANAFLFNFSNRYGSNSPAFFVGSLKHAVEQTLDCPPRDRQPLAIYLHHDGSLFVHIFCSQVLCAPSVSQYLANNFVVWAWDLSRPDLMSRLFVIISRILDSLYANKLRSMSTEDLPVLLLVHRSFGTVELLSQVSAHCTADEALSQLIQAHDVFDSTNQELIAEEVQRENRETERSQLQQAYMESLTQDQQKEELRRQEEEMRREAREIAAAEAAAQAAFEADRLAEGARRIKAAAQELPLEPAIPGPQDRNQITTLRIRPPGVAPITRRFRVDEKLRHLLAFCVTQGFPPSRFKIITTFPRRELTQIEDLELTFAELNLVPQETLTLEEKD